MAFRLIDELSFEEGSAYILNYHTAHFGLHKRGQLKEGEWVLVHGAAGGVGLIAVALAKHCGGQVVATVHRGRTAALDGSGADEVIDTDTTDLSSVQPFDLVLDLVGTDPVLPVQVTRPGGRVVGLRTVPDQQAAAARGIEADLQATEVTPERLVRLADWVEQGVLVPTVGAAFDLAEIARAVSTKEAGGVPGKIAVRVR
jgi:NADPH:quinone reductase